MHNSHVHAKTIYLDILQTHLRLPKTPNYYRCGFFIPLANHESLLDGCSELFMKLFSVPIINLGFVVD